MKASLRPEPDWRVCRIMDTQHFSRYARKSGSRSGAVGAVLLALALGVGGCAMSETQERVAGGAALGALAGAAMGTSRQSAAIGAAVGAAGGYLYDRHRQNQDVQAENERLRAENERLRSESM